MFLYAIDGQISQRDLMAAVAKNQLGPEHRQELLRSDGILLGRQEYDGSRWVRPDPVEHATRIMGNTARFLTRSLAEDVRAAMNRHNFGQLDVLTDLPSLDQWLRRNIGKVAFVVSWID